MANCEYSERCKIDHCENVDCEKYKEYKKEKLFSFHDYEESSIFGDIKKEERGKVSEK